MERLTIDEAIAHAREEKRLRKIIETGHDGEISIEEIFCDDTDAIKEAYERFENCVKEHKQIAEWLEELKDHRERECNHINEELYDKGYIDGYNKAMEKAIEIVKGNYRMEAFEKLEQLKEGGENDGF